MRIWSAHSHATVSYTHLDVYKRQSLCLLVGICESPYDAEWIRSLLKKTIEVCDPEGDLGTTAVIGGFYTEANQLYDSYIAVSYTHLQ